MRLNLGSVYHVSRLHHGLERQEFERAASRHGLSFPPGYPECICRLGYGTLSHVVDILDPDECAAQTENLRRLYRDDLVPLTGETEASAVIQTSWVLAHAVGEQTLVFDPKDGLIRAITDDADVVPVLGRDFLEVVGRLLSEHTRPPWDFVPFRKRQRFVFDWTRAHPGESHDEWFELIVQAFLSLGTHHHWDETGGRGETNRSATVYYPDFGGSVAIFLGGGGVSLHLDQDTGAEHETLDAVFAVAARQGYQPRPHPHD